MARAAHRERLQSFRVSPIAYCCLKHDAELFMCRYWLEKAFDVPKAREIWFFVTNAFFFLFSF